jgi:hypothetical protein
MNPQAPDRAWLDRAAARIRAALAAPVPPEGPSEHCRNALMLLESFSSEHPIISLNCGEVPAAMARLRTAIAQLEKRTT